MSIFGHKVSQTHHQSQFLDRRIARAEAADRMRRLKFPQAPRGSSALHILFQARRAQVVPHAPMESRGFEGRCILYRDTCQASIRLIVNPDNL